MSRKLRVPTSPVVKRADSFNQTSVKALYDTVYGMRPTHISIIGRSKRVFRSAKSMAIFGRRAVLRT